MYSKNMGVLGQYEPAVMLAKLKAECKELGKSRYATSVIPALHYICVTAQADAGRNGLHNLRMPFSQIDKVIAMAKSIDAIGIFRYTGWLQYCTNRIAFIGKIFEDA
jgi:hypothetical protein